ncbi:MAG: ParB/RepB/Spo0J family partition protein [Dehalococcoidia bacterium]|nr:MAG: ParB/RepB/Spo0J family partition protein [Dehalococcoidia bacterium]
MSKMNVMSINLDDIDADEEFNCRGAIAPIDVASLAEDIQLRGLIAPGVVIPHPDPEESGFKYKLIAGFRRRMALKVLGLKMYDCAVHEDLSADDAMYLNLNENIQRSDLTIMQEALAIAKIKKHNPGTSRTGCAEKLGMSPGWVQLREQLLNLPPEIQQEVVVGIITQTQIRELNTVLRREGKERCYEIAKEIKKAKIAGRKPRIIKKKNRYVAKARKKEEIFEMMADMNDSIPYKDADGDYHLWPRALAWASGQITDSELFETCERFATKRGITWRAPSCDLQEGSSTVQLEDVAAPEGVQDAMPIRNLFGDD